MLHVENHGSEPVQLPCVQALGEIEPAGVFEEVESSFSNPSLPYHLLADKELYLLKRKC